MAVSELKGRDESSSWYVAETLPRSEFRSQQHLERQDFACFLPRFLKTRRHARRVEQILAPVFPGYIFVRFDPDRDQWRSINGTLGVKYLVGSASGRPQPMPDDTMVALFSRCEGGVMATQLPALEIGQRVRLVAGPLVDQIATIEQFDDRGRVRILLDILGGPQTARVPINCVGPV